jgi:hypothetical protein
MNIVEEENKKHTSDDDECVHIYFMMSAHKDKLFSTAKLYVLQRVIPYHRCFLHNSFIGKIDIPPES